MYVCMHACMHALRLKKPFWAIAQIYSTDFVQLRNFRKESI
jgi:hypothetical protein